MVQQVPGALLRSPSHPQQKENSEGKFPNSPEKLSDGMNEKLMWVINIVGENAPDSLIRIKFREKPTAAEGKGSLGERGGGSGMPIGGSAVPLPVFGAPGSLEKQLPLSDALGGTERPVSI